VRVQEDSYLRAAVKREIAKCLHRDSISLRFKFTMEGIALLLLPQRGSDIFPVQFDECLDPASLEPYFGTLWYRRDFDVHDPSICPDTCRCVRHCLSVVQKSAIVDP